MLESWHGLFGHYRLQYLTSDQLILRAVSVLSTPPVGKLWKILSNLLLKRGRGNGSRWLDDGGQRLPKLIIRLERYSQGTARFVWLIVEQRELFDHTTPTAADRLSAHRTLSGCEGRNGGQIVGAAQSRTTVGGQTVLTAPPVFGRQTG